MNKKWIDNTSSSIAKYFHPIFNQHTIHTSSRNAPVFIDPENTHMITPAPPNQEFYCPFCLGNIQQTTPDKNLVTYNKGQTKYISYPEFTHNIDNILFRQQGNLFEILEYHYWQDKYNLKVSDLCLEQIELNFNNEYSKNILVNLIKQKLQKINQNINSLSEQQLKNLAIPFYDGFHELITSGYHYLPNATNSSNLFHSGYISWQEHRVILDMICASMDAMCQRNPFIQFITIFQNWQSKAGASFEHWHKQILGIDFWGEILQREAQLYKNNSSIYKDFIVETVTQNNLLIAENEHAVAYIEIGGKTGQITICSKSHHLNPLEHTIEERYAMSDLTHAILSIFPPLTPYNEEWFYTPFNQKEFKTPWRILINLRTNTVAGFENITNIYINPISPQLLASQIRELLKSSNIAPNITIDPLKITPNILQYN